MICVCRPTEGSMHKLTLQRQDLYSLLPRFAWQYIVLSRTQGTRVGLTMLLLWRKSAICRVLGTKGVTFVMNSAYSTVRIPPPRVPYVKFLTYACVSGRSKEKRTKLPMIFGSMGITLLKWYVLCECGDLQNKHRRIRNAEAKCTLGT